jgi:hypothetical protein
VSPEYNIDLSPNYPRGLNYYKPLLKTINKGSEFENSGNKIN